MKKLLLLIIIGVLQALGIAIYCGLVAEFFYFNGEIFSSKTNPHLSIMLMLILLVFSAGITGGLFFGYPTYLAIKKRIKGGLVVLASTVAVLVCIIVVVFVLLQVFR